MALSDQFQQILGRQPTRAESDFFNKFIKEGDLSEYEIGNILGSSQEAQQSRLRQQGAEYERLLAAGGEDVTRRVLGETADIARGDIARRGLSDSSSFGGQLTRAGQDIAQNLAAQRQSMLADFYGRGFDEQRETARELGGGVLERGYGLGDERRRFGQEMQLANLAYQRRQDLYGQYLGQQRTGQRQSFFGGLGGGLLGAGLGFAAGGPGGAYLGSGIGSRIGSGFGGF